MSALTDLRVLLDHHGTAQTISAQTCAALFYEWARDLGPSIDVRQFQRDAADMAELARASYRTRYYPKDSSHA